MLPYRTEWTLFQAENTAIGLFVYGTASKIIESMFRRVDEHTLDEGGAFTGTLLGVFQAAFPLQHGPA